jgi:hypothetical protein
VSEKVRRQARGESVAVLSSNALRVDFSYVATSMIPYVFLFVLFSVGILPRAACTDTSTNAMEVANLKDDLLLRA